MEEYELARVGIVKALVERAQERLPEARRAADASAVAFSRAGDRERSASARMAQAHIAAMSGDYRGALAVLRPIADDEELSADTRARIVGNIGVCHRQLGEINEAIRCHQTAVWLNEEIGNRAESARLHWGLSALLMQGGRVSDAAVALRDAINEFKDLGMKSAAALAHIDLAEAQIALGDLDAVESACRTALAYLESESLQYSANARAAVAYLCEAAEQRRLTKSTVRRVREYVERLPEHPNLLFLPLGD